MSAYTLTLFEACERLSKSKKTVSRYVRRGLLHPTTIKSKQGTLEYRFDPADIDTFKERQAPTPPDIGIVENSVIADQDTRQDTPDRTDNTTGTEGTGHERQADTPPIEHEPSINRTAETDQTKQAGQDKTGQDREIISLLSNTIDLLKDQLNTKDKQIGDLGGKIDQLIERNRETNLLLGQLQSKVLMLEAPKETKGQGGEVEIVIEDAPADNTPGKGDRWKPLKDLLGKKIF